MADKSSGPFSPYKQPTYKSKPPPGDTSHKRPKIVREHSDHLLSYYESSIPNEAQTYQCPASRETSPIRPARRHNRKLSSASTSSSDYSYDSETTDARDAGSETSASVTRRSSVPSKGGADRRRVAIVEMDSVGEGGHISASDNTSNTGSIRERRGHTSNLSGLALVAPPDAALRSYTQLTPPTTAPASGDYASQLTAHQDKSHHRSASEVAPGKKVPSRDISSVASHGASLTSIPDHSSVNSRSSTKDYKNKTNIPHPLTASRSPSPTKADRLASGRGLLSPPDSAYPRLSMIDIFSPIVTPEIGEGKEIHVPVAGPVVVNLDKDQRKKAMSMISARSESPQWGSGSVHGSTTSHSSSAHSAYLHYQPGVHATAGPLPPPPRTMVRLDSSSPPPPRPPRLHSPAPPRRGDVDAVKHALQLSPSAIVTQTLKLPQVIAGKSLDADLQDKDDNSSVAESHGSDGSRLLKNQSIHRREGATLASSIDSVSIGSASSIPRTSSPKPSAAKSSLEETTPMKPEGPPRLSTNDSFETPSVTVVEPSAPPQSKEEPSDKLDHSKFDNWLKDNPHFMQPLELSRGKSLDEPRSDSFERIERPLSPLSAEHTGDAPSLPPKSFRNSISTNLKRFSSLPRTPSLSSKSGRRSSGGTRYSSRTPSPSLHRGQPSSAQKIRSINPAALFCHEVHSQNTTLQRCVIYATKINELHLHDCGLSDWVLDTKGRSLNPQTARVPSSTPFTPQPRHTSRSSMISEATFPIRPDASTATDLSQGAYHDITPSGMPPALPYPSLALNPPRSAPARSNTSVSSSTPPSSIRQLAPSLSTSSKGTGFFASLGRKASISKKERPIISNPAPVSASVASPPGRLTAAAGKTSLSTKNISRPIITPPPTVPGGPRAPPPSRAKRSQTFMASVSPTSLIYRDREEHLGRRPSMFHITPDTVIDIQADPAFAQQVDKLAVLMPHADREVLAGYLRRAGQDLLAIGQYLEDERMGTIQRP